MTTIPREHSVERTQPTDRFRWRPTALAIAVLALALLPLIATPHGGFLPSPSEIIASLAVVAAARAWIAVCLGAIIAERREYVRSLACAALLFLSGACLLLQVRPEIMVLVARAQITATLYLGGRPDGEPYKTNRMVSDGDSDVFVMLVYDETDADAPEPGMREKTWTRYDWNSRGCEVIANPMGGHFYLEWADCSEARRRAAPNPVPLPG